MMRSFILKKQVSFVMNVGTDKCVPYKLALLVVVAVALLLSACSEKGKNGPPEIDFPPPLSNVPDETIPFPERDFQFDESLIVELPVVNFSASNIQNNVKAVRLDFFFNMPNKSGKLDSQRLMSIGTIYDSNSEAEAKMFTYRIVASDLWNPWKDRQAKDLYWDRYKEGFLTIYDDIEDRNHFRTYFHELSQESVYSYNVQNAHELQLFRTITVVKPDGEQVMFHVNILNHEEINNPQNSADVLENSFKMIDLITDYVTKTPEIYEYFITAADDFTTTLQWNHIQGAWYSRDIERVFYPAEDENVSGQLRPRNVVRIELRIRQ